MRIFNGEKIQDIMTMLKVPEDEPIEARMVSKAIERTQRKVEGHQFDIREHLIKYDDVMNQQRKAIYSMRREVLSGESEERMLLDMLEDVTTFVLDNFAAEDKKAAEWDMEGLKTAMVQHFGVEMNVSVSQLSSEGLVEEVISRVRQKLDEQKRALGDFFPHLQKMITLQSIDTRWKEHLARVDQLKEEVSLRAYAQKDPLIEYKKESFQLFEDLKQTIRSESVEKLLKVQVALEEDARRAMAPRQEQNFDYSGGEEPSTGFNGLLAPPEPRSRQEMAMGSPDMTSQGSELNRPKLNRAERRRQARLEKKRR